MVDDAHLDRATVVVAPHPDDETLGCGGTIARLRGLGVPVGIVFATDGAAAHRGRVDARTLADVREGEATAAAGVLGVAPDALRFCRVPDGTLEADDPEVAATVAELVAGLGATRLLVPSALEPPADHVNAGHAARRAVAGQSGVEVWEYGVWAWDHWPWVEGSGRLFWARSLRSGLGVTVARTFSVGVDVTEWSETKERALACHRTQMGTYPDGLDWPTLAGVRNGTWLAALVAPIERFAPVDDPNGAFRSL
jgi:LmbE family N-acetylglucosaminyl deacetylase